MSKRFNADGTQSFAPLVQWVVVPLIAAFLLIPYIQVEALTSFQSQLIPQFTDLCVQQQVTGFKYARIYDFDQANRTAKIFCAFTPRSQNVMLDVERVDAKWVVVYSRFANQQFIWPMYF